MDRANIKHKISSEQKAGYIYLPVSTDPTIRDNVSVDSITTDLCEHTPEVYIFEEKECSTSDYDSSNNSKVIITLYAYLRVMVFGGWSLFTHLAPVLQDLLAFTIQYSSILLLWISLVGWDSLDLLASGNIVPHPFCASFHVHN